jgi:hypothetical protein
VNFLPCLTSTFLLVIEPAELWIITGILQFLLQEGLRLMFGTITGATSLDLWAPSLCLPISLLVKWSDVFLTCHECCPAACTDTQWMCPALIFVGKLLGNLISFSRQLPCFLQGKHHQDCLEKTVVGSRFHGIMSKKMKWPEICFCCHLEWKVRTYEQLHMGCRLYCVCALQSLRNRCICYNCQVWVFNILLHLLPLCIKLADTPDLI